MACQAIRSWTMSGLVGAFVDLAITFFLLCGSVVAYAASSFLDLFGLSLPCPCDGLLFGNPNKDHCLQRLLVEHPVQNMFAAQMSVKGKFPYDFVWSKDVDSGNRLIMEGGYFSSSVHGGGKSIDSFGNEAILRNGSTKQKEIENTFQRPLVWPRRRHKDPLRDRKFPSVAADEPVTSNGKMHAGKSSAPANVWTNDLAGSQMETVPVESSSRWFSSDEVSRINEVRIENTPSTQQRNNKVEGEFGSNNRDDNAFRLLEKALEEEQAARASLCLELEQERSAAASAADEAMAMIMRLQEEKAMVEMSARQYQRMVEEKTVFDAEEMNLLKEILLRREREKHFLEKEVEAYRQMIVGNKQWVGEVDSPIPEHACLESQTDAVSAQKGSPDLKWDEFVRLSEHGDRFEDDNYVTLAYLEKGKEAISALEEKVVLSLDTTSLNEHIGLHQAEVPLQQNTCGNPKGATFHDRTSIPSTRQVEKNNEISVSEGVMTETAQRDRKSEMSTQSLGETPVRSAISVDSGNPVNEVEPHVYDVHVVTYQPNLPVHSDENEQNHENNRTSYQTSEFYKSEVLGGVPLTRTMRRNSMSSIDYERMKIDYEVELLREKIRIVQEGREKLNISLDHNEKEKAQLRILDDIANQLREIRQKTSPGIVARQASLPPQPSKVMSRKRRH